MNTRTETLSCAEIFGRLRCLIQAALIVVPLALFSGQAVWAQTANPYVDKYERKDGTGSQPNATTPFSQHSATRNTTGYRVESFQQGSTVQYMLVIGNNDDTGTSSANGATISDTIPSQISNVSVPYILDQDWNTSSCATATVTGNTVTATVNDALDITGSLCRIIINGTATTVTPSLGVDNAVTLTAGAGGDSNTGNNHDGVRTIIFPAPTAATCGTNDVYALASYGGVLYKLDPTGTQLGLAAVGNFNVLDESVGTSIIYWNFVNAIGLTKAGVFYGTNAQGMGSYNQHTVYDFNPANQHTTSYTSGTITTGAALIAGSMRSDGIYFMSTSSYENDDGSNTSTVYILAFDTNTSTYLGVVASVIVTPPTGGYNWATLSNGDNAFDAQGNLYLAGDTYIRNSNISGVLYRVRGPIPSAPGISPIPVLHAELVSTFTNIYYPNGFALSGDGKFYLNGFSDVNGSHIIVNTYDVNAGALLQSSALDNFDGRGMNDLASCSLPGTIELKKVVIKRVNPDDDFAITMTSPGSYPRSWTAETGATDTATTGSQVATPGTYTMTETGVDATDLASYAPEWQCVDALSSDPTAVIASGSGASFTFTDSNPAGKAIVCTISNAPLRISTVMALVPTTTGPIMAGDTVQYTLTISNISDVDVANYTIYDIIPAGLTFVSASGANSNCTPGTQQGTLCGFHVASVPANGSMVITLTFTANTPLTVTDVVSQAIQPPMSCTANCTPTVPLAYGCGAVGSVCTTPPTSCTVDDPLCVSAPTAGRISTVKTLNPTTVYPIVAGATVKYNLTITNTNAVAVTNYTIDDIVPTGLTFASASGVASSNCTPGTQNTLCSFQVASVSANGSAVVTLDFTVNTPLTATTFYNQAIQPPADCTADCTPTVPPTYGCDGVGSTCTTPPTSCTASDPICVGTPTTTQHAIPTLGQWGLLLLSLSLMILGAAARRGHIRWLD